MGILSSIGRLFSDDGLTPVTVEQEVIDLLDEYQEASESGDDEAGQMEAWSRRFTAVVKLQCHGIVQGEDGEFYFTDEDEE